MLLLLEGNQMLKIHVEIRTTEYGVTLFILDEQNKEVSSEEVIKRFNNLTIIGVHIKSTEPVGSKGWPDFGRIEGYTDSGDVIVKDIYSKQNITIPRQAFKKLYVLD